MKLLLFALGFIFLLQFAAETLAERKEIEEELHLFQEVIDEIEVHRADLSKHAFVNMLADESIPVRKRMQFAPYWTFFAVAGADLLDSWLRIPEPKTELEKKVNVFIEEDNFHYNLFLHDVEKILGYSVDRYGSYEAVMRHVFGDDSKAVRMLVYTWAAGPKKSKDPIVTLAVFEAIEAGLKDMFETIFAKVYAGNGGILELKYFGQEHVDLEMNHTVTSWFQQSDSDDKASPHRPLAEYELTEDAFQLCLEVAGELFYWLVSSVHALQNACILMLIHGWSWLVLGAGPIIFFFLLIGSMRSLIPCTTCLWQKTALTQ